MLAPLVKWMHQLAEWAGEDDTRGRQAARSFVREVAAEINRSDASADLVWEALKREHRREVTPTPPVDPGST